MKPTKIENGEELEEEQLLFSGQFKEEWRNCG
jgi:hypothetical protein